MARQSSNTPPHSSRKKVKPCIDCGEAVHAPETEWCYECIMKILAQDSTRSLNLLKTQLPLSAQLFAAGHGSEHALLAVVGGDQVDTSIASFLAVNSDIRAVKKLAIANATPKVVLFVMMQDTDIAVVEDCVTRAKKILSEEAYKRGAQRLERLRAKAQEKNS